METKRWQGLCFLAVMALACCIPATNAMAVLAGHAPRPLPPSDASYVAPVDAVAKTAAVALPFVDDVEAGVNGWTAAGFWHRVTNPENVTVSNLINPQMVDLPDDGHLPVAHSGSACWWYGEDVTGTFIGSDFPYPQEPQYVLGVYGKTGGFSKTYPGPAGSLVSPALNLSTVQNPHLTFWTWYEVEAVDVGYNQYDQMFVEVSTDGGATYPQRYVKPGSMVINPPDDVNGQSWQVYSSRADGSGKGQVAQWIHVTIDLSSFASNNNVRIRFRFWARDEKFNGFRGWMIDDIRVEGEATPQPPHITNITPDAGIKQTLLSVMGTGFANGATISLTGPQVATAPQTTTLTTAVVGTELAGATIPNLTVGSYLVKIKNPDNLESPEQVFFQVTQESAPSVEGILPNSGVDTAATPVSITGKNFKQGATVMIDDSVPVEATWVSSTLIRGTIPAGLDAGYRNITVTNPDGQFDRLIAGFLVIHRATLTVDVSGQGTTDPAEGTHEYDSNTVVTITATPAEGWSFIHWEGDAGESTDNVLTVSVYSNVAVTAVFAPNLTVEVVGEGTTDPVPGTAPVTDASASIVATPADGWRFDHWAGDASGSDNPLTLSMDGPKSIQAVFVQEFSLTVEVSGSGTTDPGEGSHTYPVYTQVALSAQPSDGWRFDHWEGDVTAGNGLVMDGNKLVRAVFIRQLSLTLDKVGEGMTYPELGTYAYDEGSAAYLTAISAEGWRFDRWEGDLTGNANPVMIVMDDNKSITAVFVRQFAITVQVDGGGATDPQVGVYIADIGSTFNVEAVTVEGWRFSQWVWTGGSSTTAALSFEVTGDKTVTAEYVQQFPLDIAVVGSGSTTPVAGQTHVYDAGTQVSITATAGEGQRLDRWTGDVTGTDNPVTVTMNGPISVTAEFVDEPKLTIQVEGSGTTNPVKDVAHAYVLGSQASIVATPADGWRFDRWEGDFSSLNASDVVPMDGDKTIKAVFIQQFTLQMIADGHGTTAPAVGTHTYDAGTVVQVSAMAEAVQGTAGYQFKEWQGGLTGSVNPDSVTMDGNKTVTAVFEDAPAGKLSLSIAVNGGGWTDPAVGTLIVDGPTVPVPHPTTTVTATADDGWEFQYWSGDIPDAQHPETNPVVIETNDNKAIAATFYPILNITVEGNGSTDPAAGQPHVFATGTEAIVVATPDTGWRFDHWEGDATTTETGVTVSMDGPKNLKAVFVQQFTLTMAKTGEGTTRPAVGAHVCDVGQVVAVAAGPADGWRFSHWTGDVADVQANPTTVTVDASKTVTAVFVQQHVLTIAVVGSGSTDPAVGVYVKDTGTVVPVTPTADPGWRFKEWQGAATGSANPVNVTVDADKQLTAVFVQQFPLNITVEGGGSTEPAAGTPHVYDSGEQVSITATANSGWRFDRWELDLTGTTSPGTVTMDAEKNVKAVFVQQFTLTMAKTGNGSTDPAEGAHTYDTGTVVSLTATPASGSRFVRWTGSPVTGEDNAGTITMDANKTVTAEFIEQVNLTVEVEGEGSVTPEAGVHVYDVGATASLMASPAVGWRFDRWDGVSSGANPSAEVAMDADKTVKAVFVQQFALTIAVSGSGSTNPAADVYVHDVGTQISIVPTAADGWLFDHWDGDVQGAEVPANVTMDAAKTVTAVFYEKPEMAVDPAELDVEYTAGAVAFSVANVKTTQAVMPYVAAVIAGSDWLSLDSSVSGFNVGAVRVAYAENTSYDSRSGVIRITASNAINGPLNVTVVQAGKPYPPQLNVTPRAQSVGAAAGTTTFDVSNTGGQDLVWTASVTSGQGWMSITGGASGTNAGVITVSCDANPSVGERSGQIEVVASGADGSPATVSVSQAGRDGDGVVAGTVTNSITGGPIRGVVVTLTAPTLQGSIQAVTDENGAYTIANLTVADPYELAFEAIGYVPATMTGVYQTHNADMVLEPVAVAKPAPPKTISGPRSVFVEWEPNPEFDLKGYNIYRTQVYGLDDPTPMSTPVKINGADPADVYEGLVAGTQYRDETVLPGIYYVYQIQAISGQDRPSDHSDPSYPPVKGQWLTIYFPEIYQNGTGLFLWEQTQGVEPSPIISMPVSFDCAYEVSSGSMQLVARIPQALFDVNSVDPSVDITVQPSGITAGMEFFYNVLAGPDNTWEVYMISADTVGRSLYGNGALFYITAKTLKDSGCGPLDLIPFIPGDIEGVSSGIGYPGQQGVSLYDDAQSPKLIDLDLVNGLLCTSGGCLHGDANNDGVVDGDDAKFILKLWAKKVQANECSMTAGDINLDGYVDSADATLILRWLQGMDITPAVPGTKAAEGLADVSFAAAGVAKTDTEAPVVSIATVTATGSSVAVPVTLANAGQMAGFSLVVTFPTGSAGLALASAVLGADYASAGFEMETNIEDADGFGSVRIAATSSGSSRKSGETTLVTLNFTVGADVAGQATLPVRVSAFSLSDQYGFAPKFNAPLAPQSVDGAVKQAGGSIVVSITPAEAVAAGAQWSLDDGTTWRASGDVAQGLAVGTYTVTFKAVAGWNTPSDLQVPLADGEAKTETATYVQQVGSVVVTIEPEDARNGGAGWRVDDSTTVHASGQTVGNLPVGSHVIHFVDATPTEGGCSSPTVNWITPADQTVNVTADGTAPLAVTYQSETKSLAASTSGNGDWILMALVASALFAGVYRRSYRRTES